RHRRSARQVATKIDLQASRASRSGDRNRARNIGLGSSNNSRGCNRKALKRSWIDRQRCRLRDAVEGRRDRGAYRIRHRRSRDRKSA
ncbi:hypothetical protein ABTL61_19745, partial [Acinetobacter baumannii]